jgi:nicotinamide mononucleotide (NMN) deamidase PncC
MWSDKLKEAGVSIHVIATGAGAGIQQRLWEIPGSSAYLSGCSFPYAQEEQDELLGFMPDHFCSEEAAVDLASAAYMKAYRFGKKKAVGVGITGSVTSDKDHRGEHRAFICIMTDNVVVSDHIQMEKGVFKSDISPDREFRLKLEEADWRLERRQGDGLRCDMDTMCNLFDVLGLDYFGPLHKSFKDVSELAMERFMVHPFFAANGKRLADMPKGKYALMPGAFNPPHEGHYGAADATMTDYNYRTVFEVTAQPPHKDAMTVQTLLQRAKLLQGNDRIFTSKLPLYLDKARKYPGTPIILGADAMVRMLDPKWGLNVGEMMGSFYNLKTNLFVAGRDIDGKFTTCQMILDDIKSKFEFKDWASAQIVMKPLSGEWHMSSTEIRNKLL